MRKADNLVVGEKRQLIMLLVIVRYKGKRTLDHCRSSKQIVASRIRG
jgi:hypothetical protein